MATVGSIGLIRAIFEESEERLGPSIVNILPKIDSLWNRIQSTWEGVDQNGMSRTGRNASGTILKSTWAKNWIVSAGGAGAVRMTNPAPNLFTDLSISGGLNANVNVFAQNAAFPSVDKFAVPRFGNARVGLVQMRGILALPWQIAQADKVEAMIVDYGKELLKGAAQTTTMTECVQFFSRNPTWGECLRSTLHTATGASAHPYVTATDLAGNADTSRVTISRIFEEDQIHRLRPGMAVDILEVWADVAATYDLLLRALDTSGFLVDQVDHLNEKVCFVTLDGGAATNAPRSAGLAAGDKIGYIVVLRETFLHSNSATNVPWVPDASSTFVTAGALPSDTSDRGWYDEIDTQIQADIAAATSITPSGGNAGTFSVFGADGLQSWIKGTTATPYTESIYSLSMNQFPDYLSLYISNVGDYLTEAKMQDWLLWFQSQYTADADPDAALTTHGVVNGYTKNLVGSGASGGIDYTRFNYDRANKPLQPYIGWRQPVINVTKPIELYISNLARRKSLFMFQTGDKNLQRLVPPPVVGQGGETKEFRNVQFVGKFAGGDPWLWTYGSGTGASIADFKHAPYIMEFQHYMKKPRFVWARGLTESVGA